MKHKLLSLALAFAMVASLLPTYGFAGDIEVATQFGQSTFSSGSGSVEQVGGITTPPAPLKETMAAPWVRSLDLLSNSDPVMDPSFDSDGWVICGNTPVVIKEDGGDTYLYDSTGTNKLLNGTPITNGIVVGGATNRSGEYVGTSINMESGTISSIYGGDVYSDRTENANITIKGGKVSYLYGGSYAGTINGDTNIRLEGGTVDILYGGGRTATSVVTGTCNITSTKDARVGFYFGGSYQGTVGAVNIQDTGAQVVPYESGGSYYGGAFNGGGETGDVLGNITVVFAGTATSLAGVNSGNAQDIDITLNSGATVGDLYAGSRDAAKRVRNTKLTLAGGKVGYAYGGGQSGETTGSTEINVTAYTTAASGQPANIRAGGRFSTATVYGNTVINLSAPVHGLVTGAGYEGTVKGTATISLKNYDATSTRGLTYFSGQTNANSNRAVAGNTTLIFDNAPIEKANALYMQDDVKSFDSIVMKDSLLTIDSKFLWPDSNGFLPNDLSLDADSTLKIGTGGVHVAGDFTGGGTLEIIEGNTFSVSGTTSGITNIKLKPASGTLGSSIKVINGATASISNYSLAEPSTGYALVKNPDGIYAVNNGAVGLTLTQSIPSPRYGDALSLTVTAEQGKGVTTSGNIALTILNGSSTVHTNTVAVNASNQATFIIPADLGAGTYSVTAELSQSGLAGSVTQPLVITKRPLTIKAETLTVFSREYDKSTDVLVPNSHFKNGVLEGYYNTDSGASIDVTSPNMNYLYRIDGPEVGKNKKITSKTSSLTFAPNTSQTILDNYIIASPDLSISIVPQTMKNGAVIFADTEVNPRVGTPLSELKLVGGSAYLGTFAWQDGTITPPIGTAFYNVVFTPNDTENYDYSAMTGYVSSNKTIVHPLKITTVKKEKPVDSQVRQTYTVGNTARTVTIDLSTAITTPADAGAISFAYQSNDAATGELTNISLSQNTLSLTIPANAATGADVAALPVTVTSDYYEDFTATVMITLTDKKEVTISGISVIPTLNSNGHFRYTGNAAGYTGTPVVTNGYTGELVYEWHDSNGTLLSEAPKDVDAYYLLVKVPDSDPTYAGEMRIDFQIIRALLTVKANTTSIPYGSNAPNYSATFDGLVKDETATVTLSCPYEKGHLALGKVGEYAITPSNCVFTKGDADNYRITYQPGTLTVYTPSSDNDDDDTSSSGTPSGGTTDTTKNPDGSSTTTVTKPDGSVSETTKFPDGTVQSIETKKDGSMKATETRPDGTKVESTTTAEGKTTATVTVPESKDNATVLIPTATKPAPGQVAVIIMADGTRKIVKTSVATQDGLRVTLSAGATLEIIDNTKVFTDVAQGAWYADSVTFAASRELFVGNEQGQFVPQDPMTRGMLLSVLYRLADASVSSGGDKWYSDALAWSKEFGLSDGTNPEDSTTREQLAVLLYRYMGSPKTDSTLNSFTDSDTVSVWAMDAMNWAVAQGLLQGAEGKLMPNNNASRAEVAAIFMRLISK